ncbi:uncharacterized protein LAESUDRAFT_249500 [Laetiporus sulphureus 93-53]|uniref:Uncharacterized protein n=1 Tax=Laetiporus sulphureus 93-53 TaxID=1314785 RepID=A0A165DIV5_9APHY|nr:uncharacterized protein LAESUDRAFT_249500 [Laetiporus sulphureus 93-53]KZT04979.1 hypothetical protein LAESUDRAFT_249500 [Laetiporus sulphureus 93-53]
MKTPFDRRGRCISRRCISRSWSCPHPGNNEGYTQVVRENFYPRLSGSSKCRTVLQFLATHRALFRDPLLHIHHALLHNISASSSPHTTIAIPTLRHLSSPSGFHVFQAVCSAVDHHPTTTTFPIHTLSRTDYRLEPTHKASVDQTILVKIPQWSSTRLSRRLRGVAGDAFSESQWRLIWMSDPRRTQRIHQMHLRLETPEGKAVYILFHAKVHAPTLVSARRPQSLKITSSRHTTQWPVAT